MSDYIKREDVLDNSNIITVQTKEYGSIEVIPVDTIANIELADVQPVKQWVKLHDKHPDTEGFYLVRDQYGVCEVAEYIPDIKSWFTHKINGEIQYWIPLPELPKDGDIE